MGERAGFSQLRDGTWPELLERTGTDRPPAWLEEGA